LLIRFIVPGNPVPKGRPRTVKRRGRSVTFTPRRTAEYAEAVALMARQAMAGLPPLEGPLSVRVRFYRRDRRRADGDNMTKNVLDAMNGIVYLDDSQVVDCRWTKHVDRANPRAEVQIARILGFAQEF